MTSWIRSNLSLKLGLMIQFAFSLSILVLSSIIVLENYDNSKEDLKLRAEHVSSLASKALKTAIWDMDTEGVDETAQALMLDQEMIYLKVFDFTAQNEVVKTRGIGAEKSYEELVKSFPNTKVELKHEGEAIATIDIVMTDQKIIDRGKKSATYILWLSLVMLFVIGLTMIVILNKVIKKPLISLGNNAAKISAGELDHEIDTSRADELGNLARSFSDMQKSIRKKISDLFSLNEAGEEIMASQTQDAVMDSFLNRFQEHNYFNYGSVYLFDTSDKSLNLYLCTEDNSKATARFELGEGIIGRVAQDKKVLFVEDSGKEKDYVHPDESLPDRSLLCVPMMDGEELFGVMNFSGEVGTVVFEESDVEYCETIARLSVSRIKGLQMIALIEEQNRTLEMKVQERTASLKAKTNDINAMLQNIKQGIFTVTEDQKIHHEYSARLETILGTSEIAHQPVVEAIFSKTDIGSDKLHQVVTAMEFAFGSDDINWHANAHVFPQEAAYTCPSGEHKLLEFDWNPIFDEEELTAKIIVTVRDVTQLKLLEKESENQKRELSIIGEILSLSQRKFHEFVDTSKEFLHQNARIISQSSHDEETQRKVDQLFRNMHTIKGNARSFGLSSLTDVVHNAEQLYDSIRKGDEDWQKERLSEELESVQETLGIYESIFKDKLAGFGGEQSGQELNEADRKSIVGIFGRLFEKASAEDKLLIEQATRIVDSQHFMAVEDCLEHSLNSIPELASELGKEIPEIHLKNPRIRIPNQLSIEFENVFNHIIRNSLDHGIELPEERVKMKKAPVGSIFIECQESEDFLTVRVFDDGRGLNLSKIFDRAVEVGICSAEEEVTHDEIAELIFSPGFSTASEVSKISGRGVGMDAVRSFLAKIGGEIRIVWSGDLNLKGNRPFALEINIRYLTRDQVA